MRQHIYNFLDKTVGHEVKCVCMDMRRQHYVIRSQNKITIVTFIVFDNGGRITMFCDSYLSNMVSNFFGIENKESTNYIRDWFGDIHNLNKVKDILKFIPEKSSTVSYSPPPIN
jgi:hypothetical protein